MEIGNMLYIETGILCSHKVEIELCDNPNQLGKNSKYVKMSPIKAHLQFFSFIYEFCKDRCQRKK